MKTLIQSIHQKAILLKNLSEDNAELFNYINSTKSHVEEVLAHNKPVSRFRPVKTLRFLIASQLKKGKQINEELIEDLKSAIENRDISKYYVLNEAVAQSLQNYKQSKSGMFPNWKQSFKILFPFVNSVKDSKAVKEDLNVLADEIIEGHQLKNVKKNIVAFEGPQNYGTDHVWAAIVPENAPNVQKAYQIFFTITSKGLLGGLYKGHQISNDGFVNEEKPYESWENYSKDISEEIQQWKALNEGLNFSFRKDEKQFQKCIDKADKDALDIYFQIMDNLVKELELEDLENLVFSTYKSRLSFQVGKRQCFNLTKDKFDFIAPESIILDLEKEVFSEPDVAFLYKDEILPNILNHYDGIRDAVEFEIERDNNTKLKEYDNAAFRKAVFDINYRSNFFVSGSGLNRVLLNNERIFKISMGADYFTEEDIKKSIDDRLVLVHADTKPKGRSSLSQADMFSKIMKEGDYFFMTHSNRNLVVMGKVNSASRPATFNEMSKTGWLERSYELIAISRKEGSFQGKRKNWTPNTNTTCWQIPAAEIASANNEIFQPYFNYEFVMNEEIKTENSNMESDKIFSDRPLNQILYGPPGTGKTYNTINEALSICGIQIPQERVEALKLFDFLVEEKRIVFSTFHQSMSYEDFIEGIKPQEPSEEGAPISYKVEPGLFKQIAVEAAFSLAQENKFRDAEKILDFSMAYDKFKEYVEEQLDEGNEVQLDTKSGGHVLVDSISQHGNLLIKHTGKKKTYSVSKQRLSRLHKEIPDLEEVNNIGSAFREVIGGSNSTTNWAALNYIRTNYLNKDTVVLQERKYDWEDKYEVVKTLKKEEYKAGNGKPYVLIIDEINRGNVSAIFGELITLIEEDKRLGNNEALTVTLPYSKDSFGVPPNLFIIGTMNTADRSVEALDTALRRRFSFVEMPPEPHTIKKGKGLEEIEGINLPALLVTINKRIEKLLDKDHMIGHSYFMDLKTLKELKLVFHNKVLPLLQEYFFGDNGKMGLVLGEKFFDLPDEKETDVFAPFNDYDTSGLMQRNVYHLKNVGAMTDDEFIESLSNVFPKNA